MSVSTKIAVTRRGFIQSVSTVGAGLSLGFNIAHANAKSQAQSETFIPNAFLRIAPDNTVHIIIKHVEMGQGTFTGLATILAEELDADWNHVVSEAAPADPVKYKNLAWGAQGTGGSSAVANSFMQMRQAGAVAKQMLLQAAAELWKVDSKDLVTDNSVVKDKSGKQQVTYGQLAELASGLPVPDPVGIKLKEPKDFTLIGADVSRKDMGKTNGQAVFTQDIELPNLQLAVIARPPRFGAKVKSFDDSKTKKIPGVKAVTQISSGIAVLAVDYWTAKKGREALEIVWDNSQAFQGDTDVLKQEFTALAQKPGLKVTQRGDADQAMQEAATVLEATYEFPYLAHASMEPMNCVALVEEGQCELWYGAQAQTLDQGNVAALLGIGPENVKINTLFAGGSFGRRANPKSDYVLDAVEVAKAHLGTPVKVIWSREDDMMAGYFRPMYVHKIKAGLDKSGNISAWNQQIVGQSIVKGTAFESFAVKDGIDATSTEGASNLPYTIPHFSVGLHTVDVPVPVLWWRSVGHTHTAFSTETMINELALAAKKDPVDFRLALLKDHPRHRGVLKLVAEKSNWKQALPKNWYRGLAVHESFNSYVAQVVEISMRESDFTIERIVCAVDCGVAINPDIIKAQMEGGIGFGLSPALVSEVTLKKGQVQETNFHQYQVLRLNQMPKVVEVHIVPSAEAPTGVGEPGTPPVAPALASALAAATGQRYHQLPLKV